MASREKFRGKNFQLILIIILMLAVQLLVIADNQKMFSYHKSFVLDKDAANSRGEEVYSIEEISYFKEIALKVEYGSGLNRIHKWTEELRLKIKGNPSSEDEQALENTLQTLNTLSKNLKLRFVQENERANVQVYFLPHSEFWKYITVEESILRNNWGLGAVWWNEQGEIYYADVLIATDCPNAEERAHLIREELTQSLGVLNDSWKDSESIFYQGWGTQDYTELDKKVVQILYHDRIRPNMQEDEIERVLARLNPNVLSFIAISETG